MLKGDWGGGATKLLGPVNRGGVRGLKILTDWLTVVRQAIWGFGHFQVPNTKRLICTEAKQPWIRRVGKLICWALGSDQDRSGDGAVGKLGRSLTWSSCLSKVPPCMHRAVWFG